MMFWVFGDVVLEDVGFEHSMLSTLQVLQKSPAHGVRDVPFFAGAQPSHAGPCPESRSKSSDPPPPEAKLNTRGHDNKTPNSKQDYDKIVLWFSARETTT